MLPKTAKPNRAKPPKLKPQRKKARKQTALKHFPAFFGPENFRQGFGVPSVFLLEKKLI
jgi:hypothetical protein